MRYLFTPNAVRELQAMLRRRSLLAFDFDGTLAPIVGHPGRARVPLPTLQRLARLARGLPVAVISGRSVADVRRRLGFEPWMIVGSHGAEDPADPDPARFARQLEPVRSLLAAAAHALSDAGVSIEDKGASIALHYRLARDRTAAQQAIAAALRAAGPGVSIYGGKMVVNVVVGAAADKAGALRLLVARSGVSAAVFVGDDANDEPVFRANQPDWFTIRVGRDPADSAARYFVDSPSDLPRMLDCMLTATKDPVP